VLRQHAQGIGEFPDTICIHLFLLKECAMKKNNTTPGNDLSEETAIREVVESNIESVKHAPKDPSNLNLRSWLHIESLLRQTKAEKEKRNRLKSMWGRIADA